MPAGNITSTLSFLQISADIGPLLLAIVATVSLILPLWLRRYNMPAFSIAFYPFTIEDIDTSEVQLKIRNVGRSVAHNCKVNIEIKDLKKKSLMELYLPWIKTDVKEAESGAKPRRITYREINMYPGQSEFLKFLFFFYRNTKDPELGLSVFGSFHSWYYYGTEGKDKQAEPPFSQLHPLYDPGGDYPVIEDNKLYRVDVRIYSEERSKRKTKKIYFKVNADGIWGSLKKKPPKLLISFKQP